MDTLLKNLKEADQLQVAAHVGTLTEEEKGEFVKNCNLDYQNLNKIFKLSTTAKKEFKNIKPLGSNQFASTITSSKEQIQKWHKIGMEAISLNKVAVILLAGGQGTRLGSSDPKGCFDIGLPSHKSLFQYQAERIQKIQQLASTGTNKATIIWYVMTSGPTRKPTEDFFKAKNYFGMSPENIIFFEQGVLPAFTPEGKIIMSTKTDCAFSPDGNGGIYAALKTQGIIADLEKRNIPYVHAYCVDNCLVKVADPVFIGYCIEMKADCAAKSIPKVAPSEQVGVICLLNDKPAVVEYSEIPLELSEKSDEKGLWLNAANIANHFYTTEFLKGVVEFEDKLEYHVAHKKIPFINSEAKVVKPEKPNGIKLELFIFDVFPFTKNFCCLETLREEEFSPLKNASGNDSPETSRNHIMQQHRRFAKEAGAIIEGEIFEISPLVSYGGEGLEKLSGKVIKTPIHIANNSDL